MKIAVAIDGSDNALRAAEHSMFLACHLPDAHLEVIYVADFNKAKEEHLTAQSAEGLAVKREKIIQPIIKRAKESNIDVHGTILKGSPREKIISYVNEEHIDLLVIGSRGLNVFQEMVLGSVSHKVMKHANCPVTVVK